MTDRSHRDSEYVLIRDSKPKKSTRYYYDADDDNDSQPSVTTKTIVRTKPTKEPRIRYVTSDELESDYRRPRVAESIDRGIKVRQTTNGEQIVLDEDNNVIKIIRNSRTPTPPYVENRRQRIRPRETRAVYYETADGHLVTRSSVNAPLTRSKDDFIYAEDEPAKVVRKVIVDPRTGNRETIYEKEKPKKQVVQQKYVIRQRPSEVAVDSENEDDEEEQQQQQQPQYVQVVQRRRVPKQEAPPPPPPPTTKYMMIRKKVDSEPIYAPSSSVPTVKTTRRIVYESPPKKSSTTYVYASNGKYYK